VVLRPSAPALSACGLRAIPQAGGLRAGGNHHPQLGRWPQLHLARADLLGRLGRAEDAVLAYRAALELEPTAAERDFIIRRVGELTPDADSSGSVGWPDDQPERRA